MADQLAGRVAASHEWTELELPSAVADRVVLASIDTFVGSNTADVRMKNVNSATMELFVEEEQSADDETRHDVEDIGFFSARSGPLTDRSGTTIGEAGTVSTGQADRDEWHSVSLNGDFSTPVAFAQVMSYDGPDPCHIRLRSVDGAGFEFQIEEWGYLGGPHTTERIGYVVLEEGIHQLDGGVPLEVDTTVAKHAWAGIGFGASVGSDPVLITRCQTQNGSQEVVTRNRNVSGSGASVRLQEEEARDGQHVDETVGYLAMPQLRSAIPAEHVATTHEVASVRFHGTRPSEPVVLASIDTFNGSDTADARLRNVRRGGMEVFVEEEGSEDSEMNHYEEAIGFLRTGTGPIYDQSGARVGEAGVIETDQPDPGQWHQAMLDGRYTNPVVFAQVMTYNGTNPCHVRIMGPPLHTHFLFQIEEWGYLDGRHDTERIGYVVMEEGVHDLAGGDTVEVGKTEGDDGWTNITFSGPVGTSPVLVSRSQTRKGSNEIVTRHRNVSASGAEIRLQEEQGRDGKHTTETIGYIAAPRSTPNVTTGLVEATDEWVEGRLAGVPSTDPVVLGSVETFNGDDPVGVRMRNVGSSGFELFLEEENSTGAAIGLSETAHTIEDVALFATTAGRIHDGSGAPIGEASVLEVDQPEPGTWHTVSLDGNYTSPVVFAQIMTYNGENPSHTRIRNVGADSFDLKIEEWGYLDGRHDTERIGYVVIEEGVHELEGELPIEAGTVTTNHEFEDYEYDETFKCNPVLVSHCQTYNGWHEIVTRNKDVKRGGALVRVQEEEARNGDHTDETIGYLVAPQLVLGSRRPIHEFRPSCHGFEFNNSFHELPDLPNLPANIDNMVGNIDLESIDQSYGLCGGMSLAAKDFFMHDREIPSVSETPQSGPLFDYLWERQLDTFDHASGWDDLGKFVKFYLPTTNTRVRSVSEFRRVKDALDTGRPVVVGLVYVRAGDGNPWDNHQVLAYDYTESGGTTYINIYDPNEHGHNDVVVHVNLEDRGWPASGHKINAEQRRGTHKMHNVIGMIYMDKPAQNPPQGL